jgi:hypothetical protein
MAEESSKFITYSWVSRQLQNIVSERTQSIPKSTRQRNVNPLRHPSSRPGQKVCHKCSFAAFAVQREVRDHVVKQIADLNNE